MAEKDNYSTDAPMKAESDGSPDYRRDSVALGADDAGAIPKGTIDPVYEAKARVLNRAIQDIGMGWYQWRKQTICDQSLTSSDSRSQSSSSLLASGGLLTISGPSSPA